MTESKSMYETVNKFYSNAVQHVRGQTLLSNARRDLGECVLNLYIKDGEIFQFIHKNGEYTVKKGRGEPAPGARLVEAEITAGDFLDMLEGKLAVIDALNNSKVFMRTVGAIWDFKTRPFVSLWGSLTRVGQDIVAAEKVKAYKLFQ
jgi:hypothetical protein